MKFSYIFLMNLMLFSNYIKPSAEKGLTTKQERIKKLDSTISKLRKDTQTLNNQIHCFNTFSVSEDTKKRYKLYSDFVVQMQAYRDAIDQNKNEDKVAAQEEIRAIKAKLIEF